VLATPTDENSDLLILGRLSMRVSSGITNGRKWASESGGWLVIVGGKVGWWCAAG
jgi:hypothetical protein